MPAADTYQNPLVRDGQSQDHRELKALLPDYVKVDERSREDLMAFAEEYTGLIHYYNDQNQKDGTWEDFFRQNTAPDQPHYALFLAFTWLFRVLQQDINTLTERHLDHYYKEILKLNTKPAKEDTVHLLFELAKNVDQHLLEEGTLLKAGKDDTGKELFYALDQDLVLNKAKVAELKTVFREPRFDEDGNVNRVEAYGIYASPVADSSDGLGADQGTEGFQWKLFGESQNELEEGSMPKAALGFMVASPILYLQEGIRGITLDIIFKKSLYVTFIPYLVGNVLAEEEGLNSDALELITSAYQSKTSTDAMEQDQLSALNLLVSTIRSTTGISELISNTDLNSENEYTVIDAAVEAYLELALEGAFNVSFSTAEGWSDTYNINGSISSSRHIKLQLNLDRDQPAIDNYAEDIIQAGINTTQPVMKVLLNEDAVFRYDFLQPGDMDMFVINVEVQGVKNLVLQNDTATLNADKPFQPFGPLPLLKSNLYVGNNEVFNKSLLDFELNIEWADAPEDFATHYAAYNSDITKVETEEEEEEDLQEFQDVEPAIEEGVDELASAHDGSVDAIADVSLDQLTGGVFRSAAEPQAQAEESEEAQTCENFTPEGTATYGNDSFTATLSMLDKGEWCHIKANSSVNSQYDCGVRLFENDNTNGVTISARLSDSGLDDFPRATQLSPTQAFDNNSLNGFVRLQLNPNKMGRFEAFGHKAYPSFYTEKIIEKTNDEDVILPLEPYTPLISSLSINYSSKTRIKLSGLDEAPEQFFHISPFGTEEKHNEEKDAYVSLFPRFEDEGTLYIGVSNLAAPQNLSLLFQVNEKSVNHEFVGKVATQWSYLSETGWKDFQEQEILEDHTAVFTRSGIVKFSIPKDITSSHTELTDGLYWLKASVPQNTLGIADAYQIASQAVTATFVNQDNATSHLSEALAADTIKKLKVNDSKVKKIQQPYGSFGGQLEESSETFNTRVSERLRHKHRAISIWDYERIILEAFPSVYKVKCLNHYNPEVSECQRQLSPGAVTMLILSKVSDENELSKRLAPITNVITLGDIKSHLKAISSPFISGRNQLFVQNPGYEYLRVKCSVKFREGYDQGYYQHELNTDIQKYFSPWAFDGNSPITFERKVYKSLVINYIEELEYVDFVCCFHLQLSKEEDGNFDDIPTDTYEASDPAHILISAAEHKISLVTGDLCDCKQTQPDENETVATGIGAMIVEFDFQVYQTDESES